MKLEKVQVNGGREWPSSDRPDSLVVDGVPITGSA
jgi:hypothetical protein